MEELLAITFLTLISAVEIIQLITGRMLPLAAVLIFFILVLVFLAVFLMGKRQFWKISLLLFTINLFNLGYLFLKLGRGWALGLSLLLCLAGLFFSAMNLANRRQPARLAEPPLYPAGQKTVKAEPEKPGTGMPHGFKIEEYIRQLEAKEQAESKAETAKPKEKAAFPEPPSPKAKARKATFSPGKFVASKTGRQYHRPRCVWAKRISKVNQVWFLTKDQAQKKGYTKHWCLK